MANTISKVIYGDKTLIDLTADTVTAESMLSGVKAHSKDGTQITGTIASKTSTDMTISGAQVTAPAGYYASDSSKSVASGTQGTPVATKGDVSNNSISVTPTCTDTTGYITGSKKTGTAVTVSASELVSGTKSISSNGTSDVTNYKNVSVNVPTGTARTEDDVTVSGDTVSIPSGLYAEDVSKSVSTTTHPAPTVTSSYDSTNKKLVVTASHSQTAGYVSDTAAKTATLDFAGKDASNLSVSGATVTADAGYYNASVSKSVSTTTHPAPTVSSSYDSTNKKLVVTASHSQTAGYVSDTAVKTATLNLDGKVSSDLTVSGATVTAPAGYYNAAASKSVASGTQGTPTATKGTVSSNSISITPSCTDTTGYITGTTKTGTAVTVTAGELVSGTKTITTNGTVDVTNYKNASVSVPTGEAKTSDDITVSGATVTVPAGLYSEEASKTVASGSATTPATTITANPSLSTTYTSGSGYKMSVSTSQNVTPNVSAGYVSSGTAGKITVSGSAYVAQSTATGGQTLPSGGSETASAGYGKVAKIGAGYYPSDRYIGSGVSAGSVSASATGSATISSETFTYNSTNGNFDVAGSASISGTATATVTAGYVSGNKTGSTTGTATLKTTVPKIVGSTAISGTTTTTPAISRTTTTATGATNVGSGTASTTAPSSGYFVSVQSAQNTGTLTATPSVSAAGYGNSSNHGIGSKTATVGANASAVTYVTVPGGSVAVNTPTIDTTTGVVTGSASVTAGYVTGTPSSKTLSLTTQAAKTVTPTESSQTAVAKNVYTTGAVTVGAISSTYIGSGVTKKAATTYNTSTSDQTISSGQYLNGAQTIKAVTTSNISAANIKTGVVIKVGDANSAGRIANVTGTFTSDANATAAQILSGKTAYVNGSKLTGSYVPYISFSNKTIATSAWASDSTYRDYPYKATITCSGATADMFPYVEFSEADAQSNLFFEGAASGSNSVTVYASAIPSATITIPTITFYKRS